MNKQPSARPVLTKVGGTRPSRAPLVNQIGTLILAVRRAFRGAPDKNCF